MPEPNTNPNPQDVNAGGSAAPAGSQQQGQPAQPSVYNELKAKKGFKSEEDLARSYVEAETAYSKHQNITNKVKQQLESAGYTIDDEGNVRPVSGGQAGQGGGMSAGGQGGGNAQDVIYDPYTGMPITDPVALQLAKLPVGQREAFIFNAMLEKREQQQGLAFQADQEVLSKPEARGFEDDVRKVMQALPLHLRADKKEWEKALLQVKGARYDSDRKRWAEQGVNDFINREELQGPAGAGGSGGGARLTPDQEQSYQWYQKNQPGMFKDRAHFARALSPTGGR